METAEGATYDLKLDNFEGPFDLLFHLIEKNEMDIYDIKISEITDQYLDFLMKMERLNMDVASEFLVTAATLLHIKSRMLLPTAEDEEEVEDPREQLVLRLLEYKKCKSASSMLRDNHARHAVYFYRKSSGEDFGMKEKTYTLSPGTLKDMYLMLGSRAEERVNKKTGFEGDILRHEKYTVGRKLRELVGLLFRKGNISFFNEFKKDGRHRLEIITGFLSMLELAMEKKARLSQRGIFTDITIAKTDKLQEDDFKEFVDIYK
ncbi:MAG: segregation/condensation protein A [Clostridia bacterium]|nr:segregation/condensation protein A [Clostridia bacterium]